MNLPLEKLDTMSLNQELKRIATEN
jgi:hypothetical protein